MRAAPRGVQLLGLAALALLALAPPVTARTPTVAVRVPASAVGSLGRLGLRPAVDLDYGGFRWLELDDAQLATLAASGLPHILVEGAGTVRVLGYAFDPLVDGEPQVDATLGGGSDPGLRLVQLVAPVRDEWVAELAGVGLTLLQYYPSNTYLVWSGVAQAESAGALPFVRWQGPFHPSYKINADLAGRTGTIRNVDVMLYNDGRVEDTLAALESLGAVVLEHYPSQPDLAFFDAIVEIEASAVEQAATLPAVLWLGGQSTHGTLDDEVSDQIVAGNYTGGVPFVGYETWLGSIGFDGTGVIWSITDTGVDYDHPDLGPHIVGGHDYPGCTPIPGQPGNDCRYGHGTHVAGIVGGTAAGGFTDPQGFKYGLGVAPGVGLFAQNSLANGNAWPPAGGWQEHSKWAVLGGAAGGNQSWGTHEGTGHGYQVAERTHDIMVRDGNFETTAVGEPYIQVFGAGNFGPGAQTLTAPTEAKNLIAVAASMSSRSGSIDAVASYSSRGPTVDGRIKPDVTAPGDQVASAYNNAGSVCGLIGGTNNLYSYCSGTSMASAHVSGALALLTEWWRSFNDGATESPAMAKALLVNDTVDMGTADRPNANEGWGRVNLQNTLTPDVPVVYEDQRVLFTATGESQVISVGIPDPSKPLKVTLVWSDAPGAAGANPALVNDLDLSVVTNGATYLGNEFSAGWSTTGGAADNKNNVENVFVQSPGGSAVITILASSVNGDGVPYNGDPTDQDFALVCSNCAEHADFTIDVTPIWQSVCAPADATFDVAVGQTLGFANPVDLAAAGNPSGTTAGFSVDPVTPPGTSVLTIGSTGAAAAGSYPIPVSGTSTTGTTSRTVTLDLFTAAPGAVAPVSPADHSTNQPALPTFTWGAATQAGTYDLQVATDPGFATIVLDATGVVDTAYTPTTDLAPSTRHYWRVRAANGCGFGPWSAVRRFATTGPPGECGVGTVPLIAFSDDFESGVGLWTHGGTGDTWALSGARVHSGANAFHALDPATSSDQRLVSPSIAIPATASPLTLQFWNWQRMEIWGVNACFDGGIVEVSTDGGASWTYLPFALMLTDPYNGPVSGLAGLSGWCSDPAQGWLSSVVNIDAYAGMTVKFRFRLGSDSSAGMEGWYIDDVKVQSCTDSVFADDFEGGGTSAWSAVVP